MLKKSLPMVGFHTVLFAPHPIFPSRMPAFCSSSPFQAPSNRFRLIFITPLFFQQSPPRPSSPPAHWPSNTTDPVQNLRFVPASLKLTACTSRHVFFKFVERPLCFSVCGHSCNESCRKRPSAGPVGHREPTKVYQS